MEQKQTDLHHKQLSLIQDVSTRWNSAYHIEFSTTLYHSLAIAQRRYDAIRWWFLHTGDICGSHETSGGDYRGYWSRKMGYHYCSSAGNSQTTWNLLQVTWGSKKLWKKLCALTSATTTQGQCWCYSTKQLSLMFNLKLYHFFQMKNAIIYCLL